MIGHGKRPWVVYRTPSDGLYLPLPDLLVVAVKLEE
jgi:hypothetical protein